MNETVTTTIEETNMVESVVEETKQITSLLSKFQDAVLSALPTIISAILFLVLGLLCIKILLKVIYNILDKSKIDKIDQTASGFIKSAIRIILYIFLGIIVLSILKVPMTSIVTVIGTMGVTIGLALKDSLSNVSGGFIILLNRPFRVGDYVETAGVSGTVEQIGIFYTTIVTSDNKTAHVPNGTITNCNIVNYSQKEIRRLDLEYTISYDCNFQKAKSIIYDVIINNDKVLQDKDIIIRMGRQDASSIVIFVKVWTTHENYWDLNYDLNEDIKIKFDNAGIEIPFTQLDIHLKGDEYDKKPIKQ
ncbi:MAG: mechanosensitive ion channel [Ruminococcus sp.]|nr:mechanosensitive ion channel [Ruminococcus sp.]